MRVLRIFGGLFFLFLYGTICLPAWAGSPAAAGQPPHTLAVGTTYIGGQIHWGFSERWALEFRVLKGDEEDATAGTVTGAAYGVRGYRYFRKPNRVRFFAGLEVAATRSYSSAYDYETTGTAVGGFAGSEIYLLKRLSVGLDVGPYLLSTKVRRSNTQDGEVAIVINSFMNFYFL